MTTHVFVVDKTTFKVHLEYLFAGTGAKENNVDFNNSPKTTLHHTTENMLVGMISDACRVRKGDQVVFYLQQDFSGKINEGKFYGVFIAREDSPFLDKNDSQQYLKDLLKKSLTFRTLIEPSSVYADGVTEWEALDEIKGIAAPAQMLWSLIYRKLKGNRGNTMVTIYEAERLLQLIRNKNNRSALNCQGKKLSFNAETQKIICINARPDVYAGRKETINILPRLLAKYREGNSFEAHLQAYIVQNLGKRTNASLDASFLNSSEMEWLGNEVSCGVGMQRIDVMPSLLQNAQRILAPVELKAVEADEKNTIQMQRYVDWVEQYYIPNRQSDVQPILVAKAMANKHTDSYRRIIDAFKTFNQVNHARCLPLKYVEFDTQNNQLVFTVVTY